MHGPAITNRLPVWEKLKINRYHAVCIASLVGVSITQNFLTRKPMSSSLLKHVLFGTAGHLIGTEVTKFVEERRKMRVLILEDYIHKHPEDFPAAEPKTYGDVLLPWAPSR